ncbi:MAG: YezD family protein [Eubacteriales bacterium]|nr:YezD family protein [Eubacteriales bacterium]
MPNKKQAERPAVTENQLRYIQEIAKDIQYGTITLVFQDGILVQVDRYEKKRIPREQDH